MSLVLDSSNGSEAGQLAGVVIGNAGGPVEIRDKVTGVPTLDLSTDETSQMTFDVADPDLKLLASGAFSIGNSIGYLDLDMEVAAIEVGGGADGASVSITARTRGIVALKGRTGAVVAGNVSPTDFARREAESVGLAFVGQDSAVLPQIARTETPGSTQPPESSWDVITRLAGDLGYLVFEARGTLYFGQPSWLIAREGVTARTVRYPEAAAFGEFGVLEVPNLRRAALVAYTPPVTGTIKLRQYHAAELRPGDRINLQGLPSFEGDYLVTSLQFQVDGITPVDVGIATPVDPQPSPPKADDTPFTDDSTVDALNDSEQFVDESGAAGGASPEFAWPATGAITGRFGDTRAAAKGVPAHVHQGLDIANSIGTPIYAARAGRVRRAQMTGVSGFGSLIVLDHGGGVETWYGHPSRILVHADNSDQVSVGRAVGDVNYNASREDQPTSFVDKGQMIGLIGAEGDSTGPHLHFEVHISGKAVDPLPLLPAGPVSLGSNKGKTFRQ